MRVRTAKLEARSEKSLARRRGVILPVILFMLILLGLLGASFAFRVHADRSSMNAVGYRMHTRMAAEAGLQKVLLMLRTQRDDVSSWYNNPDELNRIIVWTPEDESLYGTNTEEEGDNPVAYRFSIVADNPFDDEDKCRYGITDESAKLNINVASRDQLRRLISQIATEDMVVQELVAALLDWRDEDDIVGEDGAEADYYKSLDTPYRPKNGRFDTIEELLLVKGFDGRVLYGEDFDRNGLLSENEKDGDEKFPLDDGDEILNRGLYPYITVVSRDPQTDRENSPKTYLYGPVEQVRSQLGELFEDQGKVDFIIQALSSDPLGGDSPGGDQPGGDADQEQGDQPSDGSEQDGSGDDEPGDEQPPEDPDDSATGDRDPQRRSQVRPNAGDDEEEDDPEEEAQRVGRDRGEAQVPGDARSVLEGLVGQGSGAGGDAQANKLRSPADLLLVEAEGGNPLTSEDLPILMEKTTVNDPLLAPEGLINVLTAPPQVLRTLPALTGEEVAAMVGARAELTDQERVSTAWLLTKEVVSPEHYGEIAGLITVRSIQFSIESLGFADHVGAVSRLQVMVEMRGPVPQILYYRDLTSLGAVYPIREGEAEFGFGGQDG